MLCHWKSSLVFAELQRCEDAIKRPSGDVAPLGGRSYSTGPKISSSLCLRGALLELLLTAEQDSCHALRAAVPGTELGAARGAPLVSCNCRAGCSCWHQLAQLAVLWPQTGRCHLLPRTRCTLLGSSLNLEKCITNDYNTCSFLLVIQLLYDRLNNSAIASS